MKNGKESKPKSVGKPKKKRNTQIRKVAILVWHNIYSCTMENELCMALKIDFFFSGPGQKVLACKKRKNM